jgi:DNA repair protein RecO (recombination protein O)
MPGLYKDEGVVLRTIKLGEADRIVTLYTRDNGKVRAVAKGIRKTKSRFGGRLEPYTRVALMMYRGRELDTITSVDILETNKDVRRDFDRLAGAAALAELVDKITPDREKAYPIYSLLVGGLSALSDGKGPSVVPGFMIKLLSLAGYHPQLTICVSCGSKTLGGFSVSLGGVLCEDCWQEEPEAVRLAPDRAAIISRLLAADFGASIDEAALFEVTNLLGRYAEFHLERPLRSLQLLPVK